MLSFSALSLGLLAAVPASFSTPLSTHSDMGSVGAQNIFTLAPVISHPTAETSVIENSYIVVLREDATTDALMMHTSVVEGHHQEDPLGDNSGLKHVYDSHGLKGYAGTFSDATLEKIRALPEVDFVEKDQTVYALDNEYSTYEVEKSAPWGLARISHEKKLSFSTFNKYVYDPKGGEGVDVYVIDTGINIKHVEFEGRASWGKTIPQNDEDVDGNGHGTHCAGTIASRKYGVAKAAHVIAVKVLGSNGSGSMSDVVAGVVWAATQAADKAKAAAAEFHKTGKTSHKGSVANMSLGGGKATSLDKAVNAAVDAGLHFAVAAGNDNKDACNYSPAAAQKAVTVGASTIGDARAYFSNHGACVDVFAPGLNILSTWTGSTTATNTISGTSMASPHTAGLLAYLLSIYPSATFDPKAESFTESLMSNAVMHAVLPSWLSALLPRQASVTKPLPIPGTITPLQLKKALLSLALENKLNDLPAKTVNLLIFNNATLLASKADWGM